MFSDVNDDVDLDALDFQVLPWLMNFGEFNREINKSMDPVCESKRSEEGQLQTFSLRKALNLDNITSEYC